MVQREEHAGEIAAYLHLSRLALGAAMTSLAMQTPRSHCEHVSGRSDTKFSCARVRPAIKESGFAGR